ncbi:MULTISPECIES: hypothetical protein [Haloferax]|nr:MULTISPECIES: hypothetical protein [Haloferax]
MVCCNNPNLSWTGPCVASERLLVNFVLGAMSEPSSFVEQTKVHLHKALETDDPVEKDFHLRNALQLCACDGVTDQSD